MRGVDHVLRTARGFVFQLNKWAICNGSSGL